MKTAIVPVLKKKDDSQIMLLCECKSCINTIVGHVYDTCTKILGPDHKQLVLNLCGDLKVWDKILNTSLFCSRIDDDLCKQCNILVATGDSANAFCV